MTQCSIYRVMRTLLLIMVCSCTVLAQGEYLHRGENGVGIGAGLTMNGDQFGLGGAFGYSILGTYDLGVSISHINLNNNVGAMVYSPSLTLHIRKDTSGFPIASVHAAYEYEDVSSNSFNPTNTSLTGKFFTFGISMQATFHVSSKSYFQPGVGVSVIAGTTTLDYGTGYSVENSDTRPVGTVSLSFISNASAKSRIILSPAIAFDKDNVTLGLGFEAVFIND